MMNEHYIKERNRLIPQAEEWANEMVGLRPVPKGKETWEQARERYNANWNRSFHTEMNRLAALAGLTGRRASC